MPVDVFASTLLTFPLDHNLIMDAVYANSTTMVDVPHFAEEFIRRKKLADKGVIAPVGNNPSGGDSSGKGGSGSGGGWNEVARKSGSTSQKEADSAHSGIQGPGFKVVPSRKKGKK